MSLKTILHFYRIVLRYFKYFLTIIKIYSQKSSINLFKYNKKVLFGLTKNLKDSLMYAIIKHSGKQYKVSEGDYLNLDRFEAEKKDTIEITDILAVNDGNLKVGAPFVEGAKVVLEVINLGKDKKVVIYKKRRRKDSKLKRGFRRQFTRVKVISIKA